MAAVPPFFSRECVDDKGKRYLLTLTRVRYNWDTNQIEEYEDAAAPTSSSEVASAPARELKRTTEDGEEKKEKKKRKKTRAEEKKTAP